MAHWRFWLPPSPDFFFFLIVVLAYFISLFACNVGEWIWICNKINLWTCLGRGFSPLFSISLLVLFCFEELPSEIFAKEFTKDFSWKLNFFFLLLSWTKIRLIDVFNWPKSSKTRIILWSKFRMFSIVSDQNRSEKMSSGLK